jgi:hypothetical protein
MKMKIDFGKGMHWGFLILAVSLIVIPFLGLSFYVQPQFDDFLIWATSNSYKFFKAQSYWYLNWSGRYTAFALISIFDPIVYRNTHNFYIISIFIQLAFLSSLYYTIRSFLPDCTNKLNVFTLFVCVALAYYWQLPSPAEAFYWIPASFSYQLGLILTLLFFSILWRNMLSLRSKPFVILILLSIAIPGTNEISLLLFLALLGLTTLLYIILNRQVNLSLLVLFIIGLICSIISIKAPGNALRAIELKGNTQANIQDIGFSIKTTFTFIKAQILGLFMKSPFLLITLLFAWLISTLELRKSLKIKPFYIIFFSLIWFGLYFLLHIPYFYKAGIVHMPGRISNITQIVFILGFWGTLIFWIQHLNINSKNALLFSGIIYLILIIHILFQFIMPNKIQSATRDLFSGNARNYSQKMQARFNLLEKNQGKNMVVESIEDVPWSIYLADINSDTASIRNKQVSLYFNLASIKMDSTLKNGN